MVLDVVVISRNSFETHAYVIMLTLLLSRLNVPVYLLRKVSNKDTSTGKP